MIYTVTLNPSLDYITRLTHLKLGETNRSDSQIMYPGGKGINVSRLLAHLAIGGFWVVILVSNGKQEHLL